MSFALRDWAFLTLTLSDHGARMRRCATCFVRGSAPQVVTPLCGRFNTRKCRCISNERKTDPLRRSRAAQGRCHVRASLS
jgi:hypothetical protein